MKDKESRGFSNVILNISKDEALLLINSSNPVDRTNGYRAYKNCMNDSIEDAIFFVEKLLTEKKLYTRIEIEQLLALGGKNTLNVLIDNILLTKTEKALEPSKKKCYPLSRNLISRIIGCMDSSIFDYAKTRMETLEIESLCEVIEGVGHLVFYNKVLDTQENFIFVKNIYKNTDYEPLTVNLIIMMSAFKQAECLLFVNMIVNTTMNKRIHVEAIRTETFIHHCQSK